jgi:H/ACA ribonucleoprotein complex subunit 4
MYKHQGDESALRRVVMPLEALLVNYPKIMIKDSAIAAVCHGAQLAVSGVMAYSDNIKPGDDLVVMTTKGEAVALCVALVGSSQMGVLQNNYVCRLKRVIMDRDEYPKAWGKGAVATQKKQLQAAGKLGKHGEPIESTPAEYRKLHEAFHGGAPEATVETVRVSKVADGKGQETIVETVVESKDGHEEEKKRKHADETPEERAERKRAKQERKAAKAAKAAEAA